ncbi:hypothetical protein ACE3YX_003795 [Salmonella enterica]
MPLQAIDAFLRFSSLIMSSTLLIFILDVKGARSYVDSFLNLREAAYSGQQVFAVRGGKPCAKGVVAGISLGHVWGTSGTFLVGKVRLSSSILLICSSVQP